MNNEQFQHWYHEFIFSMECLPKASYRQAPLVMGVLNVTPDSFSDGGQFLAADFAFERAQEMIAQSVDVIDIGGESTRPGAIPISSTEELRRVLPVIERIRAVSDVCISIDTYKPEVMQAAVSAGANIINDVKALTEKDALKTVASLNVPVCLMHMQEMPSTMQNQSEHGHDIVDKINHFFSQRIDACLQAGISKQHLILDPGFGFGKTVQHNLTIVNRLSDFSSHGLPVLLGVSRKSTIGIVLNQEVSARLHGGIAIAVFAALNGVSIIRTHDVLATKQALLMTHSILKCNDKVN